ncbi:S1 family peptidase [Rhizobium ruizarguesonis]|uniref:S1 family peptidase n=1 Tax=Rhizobium ruizarguesonis TaxID=2081791 RepID=UPI0013EE61A4|nr:serine protease [Rhizobium ruizarguesonis]
MESCAYIVSGGTESYKSWVARSLRLFAISLAFFWGQNCRAWEKPQPNYIYDLSKAGVVKIVVRGTSDNKEFLDFGSGFVLNSDGYVISAAHLFPDDLKGGIFEGRVAYFNNDDDSHHENLTPLTLISKDNISDIALLKFDTKPLGMRPLPLSTTPPNPYDTLWILGFPGGKDTSTAYPVVFQGLQGAFKFEFQGIANFGNSGGPILDSEGYVVGIDSSAETKIHDVEIKNTYLGSLAKNFIAPDGFIISDVKPLFVTNRLLNQIGGSPDWSKQSVSDTLADVATGNQKSFCNFSVRADWIVIHDSKKGIGIMPPVGSALADAKFEFEFLVREKEKYIEEQEQQEIKGVLGPSPFHRIPAAGQSLMLEAIDTGRNSARQLQLLPFAFNSADSNPYVFQYFPRYFGPLDYQPPAANSGFLLCSENGSLPSYLFLKLCEILIKNTMSGYYSNDNPCLPGTSTAP